MIRCLPIALVFAFVGCSDEPTVERDTREVAPEEVDALEVDGGEDVGGDAQDTTDDAPDTTADTTNDAADTTADPDWPWPRASITVAPDASWKARVRFPDEPFLAPPRSYDVPEPRWVKFTVLTGDPTRVFFQDSAALPFHYDFGRAHLPPLAGLDAAAFDAVTLKNAGRQAILGAVLFAPTTGAGPVAPEVGVQLVSADALAPAVTVTVLELVRGAIDTTVGPISAFYMPTWAQHDAALAAAPLLAEHGFALASADRWAAGDVCYVQGWALGRLVEVGSDDLTAAWRDGRLGPDDILVSDDVGPELPPVAGVIVRRASSPASHAAILASTWEIPFVFAATDATRAEVDAHLGGLVALRAGAAFSGCEVELVVGDAIPAGDRAALAALKEPPALALPARTSPGDITALAVPADELTPAAIVTYGGKAANFGVLRAAVPDASPHPAVAFSFGLFDRLMARPAPDDSGKSLRQVISERLAGRAWPVADPAALAADLAAVRDLVVRTTFAPADVTAIHAALAAFEPTRNIRFRSSTNVEDSAQFTGAGLYDSYSGCLADELDADATGPSRCDPDRADEQRSTVAAILRVMASFWNDNAYLARLRHRVDEAAVAMGVLAHPSYPDREELANGVAVTTDRGTSYGHVLTTQLGAVSVSNPEAGAAAPEIVAADVYGFGTYFYGRQGSSLVPLGAHVMTFEDDYRALVDLLGRVAAKWRTMAPSGPTLTLDLEYKKTRRPGAAAVVEVKQVRPLPQPDYEHEMTSYLLPREEPLRLCTFQGESGSLFGNHRGKLVVTLAHRPTFLSGGNREAGFYTDVDVRFADGSTVSGAPATLPGAFHEAPVRGELDWSPRVDGFVLGTGESAREFRLETTLTWLVKRAESPLLLLSDALIVMQIEYATPQYDPEYWDGTLVTSDYLRLGACPDPALVTARHPLDHRHANAGAIDVDVRLYYPPPPTGPTAGYTAPLVAWDRTVISGLTSAPIELRGYWSQTFRPGHHNFEESFLFEPALEEGLDPALLAELEAADVRRIYVRAGSDSGSIQLIGADGVPRDSIAR